MAVKIVAMKLSPQQRVALVAIVALLLAGGAAWWWQSQSRTRIALARAQAAPHIATTPATTSAGGPRRVRTEDAPEPAVAAAAERCAETLMASMRDRARQMAAQDDATSQLAYAMTAHMLLDAGLESVEQVERYMAERRTIEQRAFTRARQLDPTHPDIPWLAAEKCFEGPECRAAQQAALRAEPDNVAVWLRAMTWARMRKDEAALEDAFKRAAAAPHYDPHRGATLLAVMDGYAGLPTPAACMDTGVQALMRKQLPGDRAFDAAMFIEMMALANEHASVIYGSELRTLCKAQDGSGLPSARQADCMRIYNAMAGGPGTEEQWIALSQLVELTADAAEGAAHRERYRQLLWLMQEQRRDSSEFNHLTLATSEVDAIREVLVKAGRWPPPAEWLPEDKHARSLILTGRPPEEKQRK